MTKQPLVPAEVWQAFDVALETAAGDPDCISRIELVRAYYTHPEFRQRLSDQVWEMTRELRPSKHPARP